jgi:hypothetical protein
MFPACQGGTFMKAWKHFNLDQRKIIVHQLAKRYKLCVIADTLEVDPSAVSKEIKRNRVLAKPGRVADQGCKHLVRFPYCCNGCVKKYQGCLHNHYINNRQLTTRRMDLPYAVTYKKRKVLKAYEYKENSRIDRSHRTYVDFLAYKHQHPHQFHIQMDFLGSILTDKKSILTLTFPDLHYVMLFLVEAPTSEKIIHIFHQLELQLSTKIFAEVFPFILTDRDPCFSSFNALETTQ